MSAPWTPEEFGASSDLVEKLVADGRARFSHLDSKAVFTCVAGEILFILGRIYGASTIDETATYALDVLRTFKSGPRT